MLTRREFRLHREAWGGGEGGVNSKHSLAGKNQQLLVALSSGVLNCPQRITSTVREWGGGSQGPPIRVLKAVLALVEAVPSPNAGSRYN